MKVILDMDPGHDDALAILLALAHPELEVMVITCCAGNAPLHRTVVNARVVLEVAARQDVPVAAGLPAPLIRPLETAPEVHGATGLDGPDLPDPSVPPLDEHAVSLLARLLLESDETVTLIPTGPLTNIAAALRMHPRIASNIERIVLMGGAVGEGNVTPSAEFNIWVDPEAAAVVFEAGVPLTMIGLDVTHQALLYDRDLERIRGMGTRVSTFACEILEFYSRFHRGRYGWEVGPVHDACAVAQVLRPGIVQTRDMHVAVETSGKYTRGRTVCDVLGVTGEQPNVAVGVAIDRDAFVELLMEALASYR